MKKSIISILGLTLIAGLTLQSCEVIEADIPVDELVTEGWNGFTGKDLEFALQNFRDARDKAIEEGSIEDYPEIYYGLGWVYLRVGKIDSSAISLERVLSVYPDAVIPYGFIELYDLLASRNSAKNSTTSTLDRIDTWLSLEGNQNFVFEYDTSVRRADVVATAGQIAFRLKEYERSVGYIQQIDPAFNPNPELSDYVDRIIAKLDAIIRQNQA